MDISRRPGRPLEVGIVVLKQLTEQDLRLTTRCLAQQLDCSHTTAGKNLVDLGKKLEIWRVDFTCIIAISASM